MEKQKILKESFNRFSKLSWEERLAILKKLGILKKEDIQVLKKESLGIDLAEQFIENALGYYPLPLGVLPYLLVDKKAYTIPLAIEETSVIASLAKTAKWIHRDGFIRTRVREDLGTGQIQFAKIRDEENFFKVIKDKKDHFIDLANKNAASRLVKRGAGVKDIEVRKIQRKDGFSMGIVHVYVDTGNAMGANLINQICEFLKDPMEFETGEVASLCILSNFMDRKVVEARVEIKEGDEHLFSRIEEASYFAEMDPYRAATHNKGILNGIDAVLIATGNDWRAVEAGAHAYATRFGKYQGLSRWVKEGKKLIGTLEAPINVGTVGGMTRLHPFAKLHLRMMGIESSLELSRVCAAVGLVQNLGALRALCTEGIIEGHMKLHIKNLMMGAGARLEEREPLQNRVRNFLKIKKHITQGHVLELLKELRNKDEKSHRDD